MTKQEITPQTEYAAPLLEVVLMEVERGFSASGGNEDLNRGDEWEM